MCDSPHCGSRLHEPHRASMCMPAVAKLCARWMAGFVQLALLLEDAVLRACRALHRLVEQGFCTLLCYIGMMC